ncbi:hypothetical protein J2X68_007689 [Streptomyces sp. 3330]|nr:hypothetical protein [Streptomyces sp. 3330]
MSCVPLTAGSVRSGEERLQQAVQAAGFVAYPGGYVAALGNEMAVDRGFWGRDGFCLARHR